jgi:hypothetical protein
MVEVPCELWKYRWAQGFALMSRLPTHRHRPAGAPTRPQPRCGPRDAGKPLTGGLLPQRLKACRGRGSPARCPCGLPRARPPVRPLRCAPPAMPLLLLLQEMLESWSQRDHNVDDRLTPEVAAMYAVPACRRGPPPSARACPAAHAAGGPISSAEEEPLPRGLSPRVWGGGVAPSSGRCRARSSPSWGQAAHGYHQGVWGTSTARGIAHPWTRCAQIKSR